MIQREYNNIFQSSKTFIIIKALVSLILTKYQNENKLDLFNLMKRVFLV